MSGYLKPWIGNNFGTSSPRFLLVGESHYLKEEKWKPGFTIELIELLMTCHAGTFGPRKSQFFSRVFRSVAGKNFREVSPEEWSDFWNSIAFYSYIQSPFISAPRQSLQESYFAEAYAPFLKVWEDLRPEVVVFYSRRTFSNMGSRLKDNPGIRFGPSGSWWQQVEAPVKSLFVGMSHPSTKGFKPDLLREILGINGISQTGNETPGKFP